MFLLAKYNTQTVFRFPMVKRGVVDLAATADWTPATGDTKVSKDGGAVANTTNNPAAVTGTGSVAWTLTLTATELSAAEINVQIVDSATKTVEDQWLTIYTYGNASAKIVADLSDAVRLGLTALPNAAAEAAGGLYTRGSGAGQLNQATAGQLDANVARWLNTAPPTPGTAGVPKVDVATWLNVAPLALTAQRVDTTVGAVQAGVIAAASFAADAIDANALATTAITEITDAMKAKVLETQGSYTFGQIMSAMFAVLCGQTSDGGVTLKTPNGAATRVAVTTDGSNNRTVSNVTPST